ncbi:acyltransferase [Rhizobium sp. RHZ02]|uniref:acyltransferase family protein n=1 Tax=Rhizobium sp. RHZ02 TaxID=2769306 RepID=UPI001781B72E|nr:acyltransferase [Rhizobium sp. RHZ02]MBD9455943.1 acyltransferase [Rhizobium sp. RHZ02]
MNRPPNATQTAAQVDIEDLCRLALSTTIRQGQNKVPDNIPRFHKTPSLTEMSKSLFQPPTAGDYGASANVRHFFGIDILRSFAAVVILIWHYQHFFSLSGTTFDRSTQPFYALLMPFYEYGYWAVGGFWVISGFVFAHVYGDRETTIASFVSARFARLYPLHFITLVAIGAIQIVSFNLLGHYTMVAGNSMTDFVRHLFFISGWGFTDAVNFNGPIWSVSVELAIYAVFFILARRLFSFGLLVPCFIVITMAMLVNEQSPVNNFHLCAFFFFAGCALYYWLIRFRNRPIILFAPAVVSAFFFIYYTASGLLPHMRFYNVQFFLFPPIVLLVGWMDYHPKVQQRLKPLKWFGDTTYSSYLWHFPTQVLIIMIFTYLGHSSHIFEKPLTLIGWVVGMVALSHMSFVHIEKPLQRFCQSAFKIAWATADRA